jgi:hypothetical protein
MSQLSATLCALVCVHRARFTAAGQGVSLSSIMQCPKLPQADGAPDHLPGSTCTAAQLVSDPRQLEKDVQNPLVCTVNV